MRLTVLVHEIDTERFPTCPAGWRWAVLTGSDYGAVNPPGCLNAGYEKTRQEAEMAGEAAAVVGVRVARLHGNDAADMATVVLDHDPCLSDPITLGA